MALTNLEVKYIEMQERLAKHQIENTLSKRDQFAIAAIQGLLAAKSTYSADRMVIGAYEIADEMMKRSGKTKKAE